MKSLKALLFVVCTGIVLISCSKEGPAGPEGAQGQQGPQGPQGPQGNAGTANVIYSSWFFPSYVNAGTNNVYADKAAPGVTQAIIDQGVVLAFMNINSEPGARPLPTTTVSGKMIWNYYIPALQTIRFTINPTDGTSLFNPVLFTIKYRYVIIPGAVAGGRVSTGPGSTVTVEALKNMSYEEVRELFNIPENGSNTK